MSKGRLLIDGDVLVYRAGFAAEKTKYLVAATDGRHTLADTSVDAKAIAAKREGGATIWSRKDPAPIETALTIVDVMIADIRAHYAGMDTAVFLSGVGNFRYGVATRATYKGNRDAPKPIHSKALVAHLMKRGAEVSAGEEADDLLGIHATASPGSVIASVDKDLMQIPGKHYNFVTKEEVTVSPKEAAFSFYAQVLSGDPVDNVPGLTGIGPGKARAALAECDSPRACWGKVLRLYTDEFAGQGERFALEAARLVYVRKKVNETWQPPK